jgi:exodeoxyribonuclease-5
LSDDQARAIDLVLEWLDDPARQTLSLGGYAGTGKTTVVRHLMDTIGPEGAAVCAFTGKAASVLQSKGVEASTMHRLIYEAKLRCSECECPAHMEGCPRCKLRDYVELYFQRVDSLGVELVIVDEASMLTDRLVEDLLMYDTKVLFVGDHGQLEPVGTDPGVMQEPDITLEEIHRQAKGSSIIDFAHHLREDGDPLEWQGGDEVTVCKGLNGVDLSDYDVVLCGFNKTRVAVNKRIRERRGLMRGPQPGDRLICLRNDYELGIYNGMLVTVAKVRERSRGFIVDFITETGELYVNVPIDDRYLGTGLKSQFGSPGVGQFDYGYCLTTHKFQGSEAERVAVLEQLCDLWSPTRWRYTAATRASERLDYFVSSRV